MSKKAELEERMRPFDRYWLEGEDNVNALVLSTIAEEAINAIPDEAEKPFVPTEEGYYKYKRPDNESWEVVYFGFDGNEPHVQFTGSRNNFEFSECKGTWLPDRILMPGEE